MNALQRCYYLTRWWLTLRRPRWWHWPIRKPLDQGELWQHPGWPDDDEEPR